VVEKLNEDFFSKPFSELYYWLKQVLLLLSS